jgi:ABC-type oligopeptide transport system substrate-binding subunit/DNA-binding SARP family transcriptional activator
MEGTIHLRLLGPVQVERDGEPVGGFRSRKALALLGYLVAQGGPIPRERLADLFWEDKTESQGRTNLSWVLRRISSRLPDCLQADRHTVQFHRPGNYWLDVHAFEELEARGDLASLAEAVALYRGEFLEGVTPEGCAEFELWVVGERERWRQRVASVLWELAARYTGRGEYEAGLRYTRELLVLEPWREEAHREMMRLLAWSGQRGAALAQYETCCRVLRDELGVEPAAETVRLYERIRDGELAAPTSAPVQLPDFSVPLPGFLEGDGEPVEEPVFVAREAELARLEGFLEEALAGEGRVAFVTGEAGQGKTALIQAFVRRAQAAHTELVVAGGNGNAHTGVGDPYLPFREMLGLLTGDVEARWAAGAMGKEQAQRLWGMLPLTVQALVEVGPGLIDTFVLGAPLLARAAVLEAMVPGRVGWLPRLRELVEHRGVVSGSPTSQQSDFFEQVTQVLRALARERPLVVILDDLQWADGGSVGLLFHLGRRIEGSRILVVGAYRPAEMALGRPDSSVSGAVLEAGRERHPLVSIVNEFKRLFGDIEVDLDRVQGRRFVDGFLNAEPNRLGESFRQALYQRTMGHPLSTIELLRGMQERGNLIQDQEGYWVKGASLDWETLPTRTEAVVAERIDRLPVVLQEMLRVASVEGETFTAEVVARVQGADAREMVGRLSRELAREHRLVQVQGLQRLGMGRLSRYRFRHSLFQRYLYDGLDPVERAYLHEAVGEALEVLYGEAEAAEEEVASITPQLAWHFQEAGIAGKAVGYLHQAGDRARGLYALQEAIDYYQRAREVLKERKVYEQMARTLMKLGLTYHLAFDFQRARQAYEEGFAAWQRVGEGQDAAALRPAPHALRVDCLYPPKTLDPGLAEDVETSGVVDQLFSGLVELRPGMDVVPAVAQGWEVLENGQKYVFHLRDDVRWSDGASVIAQDFEYAWKRVLDPVTASPTAGLLYDVKGAGAFHQGAGERTDVGVRALDEVTLEVELERPTGHFLHLLAYNASFPVPCHVVDACGAAWAEAGNIVTNGPFRLAARGQDEGLTLSRNPDYYGHFDGNVERVELHVLSDGAARLKAYEANELDTLSLRNFSTEGEKEHVRQRHAGEYFSIPWLATTYVGFNVSRSPFDDRRVRQAFALSVNKEEWADVVMEGHYFPAKGGLVPPGMPAHSEEIGLPHAPERARRLLAEAGYPGGRGFPQVEFLAEHRSVSPIKYLAGQWRETLGAEVAWQTVEWGAFLGRLEDQPPHLFLDAWYADYPDPDNFLRVCDAIRWTRWQDETYRRLVEGARQVVDQRERMAMYHRADRMLTEQAVILPFAYWRLHMLVKPWVRRFPTSAIKWWHWKDVIIEPHE